MKSNRRNKCSAAVEILPSMIRLAILEPQADERIHVETVAVPWRRSDSTLTDDEGRLELAAALRQLASQHRLANVPLHVSLSGDFCVTRIVTGLNEEVRRELAELEQRSELYLSLGHGAKATASCVSAIDARHQRAMLAVANDRVLGAMCDALERAGLQVAGIEPALVSLCRLIGELGADREHPALVVRGDERGVEVGISYGGQLLLDYRPAARHAKEQAGEIIGSHFHRLQRYCERYVRVDGGKLQTVYVSGDESLVHMVERGLHSDLAVRPLAPQAIDARWELSGSGSSPEFAAAIGAAGLALAAQQSDFHVDLIDRKRALNRVALGPALVRTLWPAAAVLLLSACGFGAMQYEKYRHNSLQEELAALEPQQAEARHLRMRTVSDKQEIAFTQAIMKSVRSPNWLELSTLISQCLPQDVWLDDVRVDGQGRLQLVGASFTEDGVFQFVRHLEQLPGLNHVALGGTRPTRLDVGPATQFDVRCDFDGRSDKKEKTNGNG
jgi:Tfp pilus assembly protein PilN